MLEAGDPAPDFYLPAADDPGAEYMLSAAVQQSPVVVVFVPAQPAAAEPVIETLAGVDWSRMADRLAVFVVAQSEAVAATVPASERPFPVLLDYDGFTGERFDVGEPMLALAVVDSRCRVHHAWAGTSVEESLPLDELRRALSTV